MKHYAAAGFSPSYQRKPAANSQADGVFMRLRTPPDDAIIIVLTAAMILLMMTVVLFAAEPLASAPGPIPVPDTLPTHTDTAAAWR
jgi:hypothetical protein